MKKLIKVIGIPAVVLVLAACAVLVAAKFLITPERVRQVVIPMAEERLNRPVSIGDINVRIFSGIVISDFVIGSKDEITEFVSAQSLVLRYRFWPLLRRSVVVDEIRLDSPEIRITRSKTGEFNFSDLITSKTDPSEPGEKSPQDKTPETESAPSIDLVVNEISILRGSLLFMDDLVGIQHQLTDFSLSVSDFSPDKPFPFSLSAIINNSPIELNGTLNFEAFGISANIRAKDLDIAALRPYAPEAFTGEISNLKLSLDLKAEADLQKVDSSGRITLSDIDLLFDDISVKDSRATLDYEIDMDLVSETITIRKADADINGILLSLSGKVLSYRQDPGLDLKAQLPMTSLSSLIGAFPEKPLEPIAKMAPSGNLGALFHLKGSPDKPKELIETGDIRLEKVKLTINQLTPEISGDIRVLKNTASSDNIVINMADERLRMNFTADNLLGDIIRINHSIAAEKLDIDRLIKTMGGDKTDPKQPPGKPSEKIPPRPQEPGPYNIPAEVKGNIRVDKAIFRGMEVNNFEMQYLLKDNVLTVNRFDGNVAGGKISASGKAELHRRPVSYTASFSAEETRAENIMNILFPKTADTVFGTMFLKSDIRGEGTTWETLRQKLTSRTDVNVINGRLSGTGLAGGLAGYLNTRRLEVIQFESLKGNLKLEKGQIMLDSTFTGKEVRMAPTGTIGLDGALDLSLDMRVAPEIASQIQIGKLYSQLAQTSDGWTMVPLGVGGTLQSPRFSLDTSAVTDQLMQRGKEEIGKQLQERVLDRLVPPSREKTVEEPDKKEKVAPEKILEETFRRLFN